jgi:hypothetical protein
MYSRVTLVLQTEAIGKHTHILRSCNNNILFFSATVHSKQLYGITLGLITDNINCMIKITSLDIIVT